MVRIAGYAGPTDVRTRALIAASFFHASLLAVALAAVQEPAAVNFSSAVAATASLQRQAVEAKLQNIPAPALPSPPEAETPPLPSPLDHPPEPVILPQLPAPPERFHESPPEIVRNRAPVPLLTTPSARPAPEPEPAAPPLTSPAPEVSPPVLLSWTIPARVRRQFRGRVVVAIDLDAEGRVRDLRIETGTGRRDFDEAILRALREAQFSPARQNGHDIKSLLRQPVVFE